MDLSPEVAGAIVGGAIGIFSASVTAVANHVNLKKRLRSKNQRRLAEFYLDKKVDALATIHTELTGCYETLGAALQNPSGYSWERVKSEVHPDIDAFEDAITVGDVYLSATQESALRATVDEYRSVADKIAILENGRQDMVDDVFDATERAGGTLAEEINAPIRRLEGAGDSSSEEQEEAIARRREVPTGHDSSNWATLATQRDRLREILRVADDGSIEFLVDVEPPGRALLSIIGRRYAYERDLVESPTVAEDDLRRTFDGSAEALESFVSEASDHLVSDDGEYFVEAEDIEAGIDWASAYVEDDADGEQ
ncbi:hypothetical protein ACFQH6_02135 [Halobacteriaceae archaeon GCM10025711]